MAKCKICKRAKANSFINGLYICMNCREILRNAKVSTRHYIYGIIENTSKYRNKLIIEGYIKAFPEVIEGKNFNIDKFDTVRQEIIRRHNVLLTNSNSRFKPI